MKPKNHDPLTLERLEQYARSLHSAIEKLTELSSVSQKQLESFSQLLKKAEQVTKQPPFRGISIERESEMPDEQEYQDEAQDSDQKNESELEGKIDFGFGHFIEFSSYEEFKKFQKLPPISGGEIEACDIDEVIAQILFSEDD